MKFYFIYRKWFDFTRSIKMQKKYQTFEFPCLGNKYIDRLSLGGVSLGLRCTL